MKRIFPGKYTPAHFLISFLDIVEPLALFSLCKLLLVFDFGGRVGFQTLFVIGSCFLDSFLKPVKLGRNSGGFVVILLTVCLFLLKQRKEKFLSTKLNLYSWFELRFQRNHCVWQILKAHRCQVKY